MRLEPSIDALDMESMATLGEQSKALVLPELAEAHRAVGAVDQSIASPVLAYRNLIDQGLVEPVRWGDVPWLVAAGLAKAVLELAVMHTPVAMEPPAEGVEAAAILGDDGVVADEEEGASEDADDGDHEGGEGRARAVVGELEGGRWWEK